MALDNDQKKAMLDQLIDQTDNDLYRQEIELAAANAEAGAVEDEQQKQFAQANANNVQQAIARLNARKAAWQQLRDEL